MMVREENIIILSRNQILQPLKLIIQTSVRMKPWKFDHFNENCRVAASYCIVYDIGQTKWFNYFDAMNKNAKA